MAATMPVPRSRASRRTSRSRSSRSSTRRSPGIGETASTTRGRCKSRCAKRSRRPFGGGAEAAPPPIASPRPIETEGDARAIPPRRARRRSAPRRGVRESPSSAPATAENDARVETARELFRHVDRLLPGVRQFGWEHPSTERALRTAFEAFAEALVRQPGVALDVRPYSPGARAHGLGAVAAVRFGPVQSLRVRRPRGPRRARAHSRRAPVFLRLLLLDPVRDPRRRTISSRRSGSARSST